MYAGKGVVCTEHGSPAWKNFHRIVFETISIIAPGIEGVYC
jgi:hypothetical protein